MAFDSVSLPTAAGSIFKHHLIPRADDLAVSDIDGFSGMDAETLMRLANEHVGALGQERAFDYEGISFRVTLQKDNFFEEGQSIAAVCDGLRA
jgi:hypothetical protein|tara:strand:- start:412 stop:690 length:279 start_codon:yes stop_codon:yes gene_type:complete